MPWSIAHKCNPGDAETTPFAIERGTRQGKEVTRIVCPKPACREEFFILGHEMYGEAEAIPQSSGGVQGMPPGFLFPRSLRG